jgi:hypothetical protein
MSRSAWIPLATSLFTCVLVVTLSHSANAEEAEPSPDKLVFYPPPVLSVEVRSGRPAFLQEDRHAAWTNLCASPCTARIPSGTRVRIAGPGILPSDPIVLRGQQDEHVRLDATPRGEADRTRRRGLGAFLLIIGGLTAAIGVADYAFSGLSYLNVSCDPSETSCADRQNADRQAARMKTTGVVLAVIGTGVIGGGVLGLVSADEMTTPATVTSSQARTGGSFRWTVGAAPVRRGGGASLCLRF